MPKTSRRGFLKGVATLIPARALGRGGFVVPSERIVMAGVGLGPRGQQDLNQWIVHNKEVQFVAIADVQRFRRKQVKKAVDAAYGSRDCRMYRDFREILARPDVDCILAAPGVRWHANLSILAMRAGKDVYTEKPGGMTIAECKAVMETAETYGRIYQAGTQRLSEGPMVIANELCARGYLGEVKTAYTYLVPLFFRGWETVYTKRDWKPAQPEPDPDVCDWDMWLGPSPWRPYNEAYVKGDWRQIYDLHTGPIAGWGSHCFAQAQAALGLRDTSAVYYPWMTRGGRNLNCDNMPLQFANGKTIVNTTQGWPKGYGWCAVKYVGTEGWVACGDGYTRAECSNKALYAEYERILSEYIARTGHVMNHMQDFLNSVRTRRPPVSDARLMYRSMTTAHAANIAQWVKADLEFDPVKGAFRNNPEANRHLSRAQRRRWQVV